MARAPTNPGGDVAILHPDQVWANQPTGVRTMTAAIESQKNGGESSSEELASAFVEAIKSVQGGGGSGGGGDDFSDALKKHGRGITVKVIAVLVAGAISSFGVTRLSVMENQQTIESHDEMLKNQAAHDVEIKARVQKVEDATKSIAKSVESISDDVGAMKKESVDELKKKLEDANRENRELKRRRRR